MLEDFLKMFEDESVLGDSPLHFGLGDESVLEALIDDIAHYDVYDFIARISSLNLLIENQNKSIVFDALISSLLLRNQSSYTGTAKMSSGKFKKIVAKLSELSLYLAVDPAENTFIERVRYHGNYWIFPGINSSPSFCMQGFLDFLNFGHPSFAPDFMRKAHMLINFVLHISDSIARTLNYDEKCLRHVETSEINVPSSKQCDCLKDCVVLDATLIEHYVPSQDLQACLFSSFENGALATAVNNVKQGFFKHPFIKTPSGSVILLNPSVLIPFAIHQIVVWSNEYGIQSQLIDGYNDVIWKRCKESVRRLGHKKIDEKAYGIELVNNSIFKEEILMVGNNQLLFLYFLCDPGFEYGEDSMFGTINLAEDMPSIEERNSYFRERLPSSSSENIYSVVVINGFGRTVGGAFYRSEVHREIVLTPFELNCIAINECTRPNFLPKYISAKSRINTLLPTGACSELNCIEMYTHNGYTFYLSDDFDPKTMRLDFGFGDSLDYVIRAFLKEKRHLISHYDDVHYADVVLNDPVREIYFTHSCGMNPPEFVVEFDEVAICVSTDTPTSVNEMQINATLMDLISYWLAECKTNINEMQFTKESICVKIRLKDSIDEYFKMRDKDTEFLDGISYYCESNTIVMIWDSNSYRQLGSKSNVEKLLIASLLLEIQKFSCVSTNLLLLEDVFGNPLKKKVFEIDTYSMPCAVPIRGDMQVVSIEDENQLLDEIGLHFLETGKYTRGTVPDDKRTTLGNDVVSYLYALLQAEVSSINSVGIYERVCFDLEAVMCAIMTCHKRYAYDVACYPEKKALIIEQYNEANKVSVALKFLGEYIAAIPPTGEKPIGEMQYNRILAICHLIVDWAYRNDLFVYDIINVPISFLPSGRIGMARIDEERLANINATSRVRRLEDLSHPGTMVYSPFGLINDFDQELDEAFIAEYGFSFEEFIKGVLAICTCGEGIKGDVKRVNRKVLIQEVSKSSEISEITMSKIVDQISLTARENFLIPPAPFTKYDVYPWRFNRELSFTRRPIIQCGEDLIWGNRQLHHMWRYVIDLITEGKYKGRNKRLIQLISKISNKRGADFNTAVYQKIATVPSVLVQKTVTKINGIKIASDDGNTLGDIDILYVIPACCKIVVGEVKDFSYAKNPYEMNQEYKKIFVDEADKACYITKHNRRVSWVQAHVNDVVEHFGLQKGEWSVHSALFVSEEIVSNLYYHKGEKIITYSDINEKSITSV